MNDQELQEFSKDEIRDIIMEEIVKNLKIYASASLDGDISIEIYYDGTFIDEDNVRLIICN